MMDFAGKIKKVRHISLLSQTDFAEALGVSFSTVNRWETGKSVPNYKTMKKIDGYCREHDIPFEITDDIWEDK